MEHDFVKIITSLLGLAVFVGILVMVISDPTGANALLGASATTIAGTTAALEGKKAA